jgi:hypothetical protein
MTCSVSWAEDDGQYHQILIRFEALGRFGIYASSVFTVFLFLILDQDLAGSPLGQGVASLRLD